MINTYYRVSTFLLNEYNLQINPKEDLQIVRTKDFKRFKEDNDIESRGIIRDCASGEFCLDKKGQSYILINPINSDKENICTFAHEFTHYCDYKWFCNQNILENGKDLKKWELYDAFRYWSEYHAFYYSFKCEYGFTISQESMPFYLYLDCYLNSNIKALDNLVLQEEIGDTAEQDMFLYQMMKNIAVYHLYTQDCLSSRVLWTGGGAICQDSIIAVANHLRRKDNVTVGYFDSFKNLLVNCLYQFINRNNN